MVVWKFYEDSSACNEDNQPPHDPDQSCVISL